MNRWTKFKSHSHQEVSTHTYVRTLFNSRPCLHVIKPYHIDDGQFFVARVEVDDVASGIPHDLAKRFLQLQELIWWALTEILAHDSCDRFKQRYICTKVVGKCSSTRVIHQHFCNANICGIPLRDRHIAASMPILGVNRFPQKESCCLDGSTDDGESLDRSHIAQTCQEDNMMNYSAPSLTIGKWYGISPLG